MRKKIRFLLTLLTVCFLAGTVNAASLHPTGTSVSEEDPGSSVDPVWPPIWWPGDQ